MFIKASNSETKINILIHKHLGKIFLVYCDFLIPQKSICTRKMHIHNTNGVSCFGFHLMDHWCEYVVVQLDVSRIES